MPCVLCGRFRKDIANETWGEESLFDLEYEDFVGTLEAFDVEAELDEDDYNAAIEKISKLEIKSGGLYDYDDGGTETTLVYDPIAKKYVGNNGPVLKSNQIYGVTDEIRKGLGKIGKASDEASVADLSLEDAYTALEASLGLTRATADDYNNEDDDIEDDDYPDEDDD